MGKEPLQEKNVQAPYLIYSTTSQKSQYNASVSKTQFIWNHSMRKYMKPPTVLF